jgi:2-C-methyl-D-erythritol 4-phosphate cytidylyltransferase
MARAALHNVAVIIAAGGTGRRMGRSVPKQFLKAGKHPILVTAVKAFERIRLVRQIVVVVPRGYAEFTHRLLSRAGCARVSAVIEGGKERQDSVRQGLAMLTGEPDVVMVHDAVRPFVTRRVILQVASEAHRHGAAAVGVRVKDTIKQEGKPGFIRKTLPRQSLWAIQTPQGFRTSLLQNAHVKAFREHIQGTDDAMLVEKLGIPVRIVEGEYTNIKITTREDLVTARNRLKRRK